MNSRESLEEQQQIERDHRPADADHHPRMVAPSVGQEPQGRGREIGMQLTNRRAPYASPAHHSITAAFASPRYQKRRGSGAPDRGYSAATAG